RARRSGAGPPAPGQGGWVLTVGPLSAGAAAGGEEPGGPVVEAREVADSVDDGGCARDRRARLEGPAERAGAAVERVEDVVVRADEDEAVPDTGRGVDVAPGAEAPQGLPAQGRQRIDPAVERADVHAAGGDGGG